MPFCPQVHVLLRHLLTLQTLTQTRIVFRKISHSIIRGWSSLRPLNIQPGTVTLQQDTQNCLEWMTPSPRPKSVPTETCPQGGVPRYFVLLGIHPAGDESNTGFPVHKHTHALTLRAVQPEFTIRKRHLFLKQSLSCPTVQAKFYVCQRTMAVPFWFFFPFF